MNVSVILAGMTRREFDLARGILISHRGAYEDLTADVLSPPAGDGGPGEEQWSITVRGADLGVITGVLLGIEASALREGDPS